MPQKTAFIPLTYRARREDLAASIKEYYGVKEGVIILIADLEAGHHLFEQESSFFYYTGVAEAGLIFMLEVATGKSTLFIPNLGSERQKWMANVIQISDRPEKWGVDEIKLLGPEARGYQIYHHSPLEIYEDFLRELTSILHSSLPIFTFYPVDQADAGSYFHQRFLLERFTSLIPSLTDSLKDISLLVGRLRSIKTEDELMLLQQAIDITYAAQQAAAHAIGAGRCEYEVQALLEAQFIAKGAIIAFPSIVGSGLNSTILHYNNNNKIIEQHDVVVVDIGARYGGYCADITRTYPVQGSFSDRQREIYLLVLEAQEFIAQRARAGMWLSNAQHSDQSLNHMARQFFKERGYEQFFPHGIGHYLGLDVHDVGDYSQPLQVGQVITIEPGLYIPQEQLGIRIEDNYVITDNGVRCLSQSIPKLPEELIEFMNS